MPYDLSSYSKFKETTRILFDGKYSFGMWNDVFSNIDPTDIMQYHVSDRNYAGRPDLIADDVYDNHLLSWVIIMYNKPINTMNWPPHGSTIQIPTAKALVGVI